MDNTIESSRSYDYWKWRIIFATMACYLFYYCGRFNLAICASPIAKEFGFDNTKIGFLTSALILTYGFGQFINGNLGDRFGRVLMPIGAVVSCIFNWVFSFTPEISRGVYIGLHASSYATVLFTTMTLVWGVNGYFQAMGMAPGGRLISNWWPHKQRGLAMGLYTGAAGMSNVTVFLLASWLAGQYGWRAAFRFPPLLMATVAVIFYFVTRDHPEDVGLESSDDAKTGKHGGTMQQYAAALKHRSFMFACLSLGFHHITRWGLLSFLPKFFAEMAQWNVKKAGFMATALPLGMAFGALSGGYISDKFFHSKRGKVIFISLILCAICTVLIPYVTLGTSIEKETSDEPVVMAQAGAQDQAASDDAESPQIVLSSGMRVLVVVLLLVAGFFLYVCIGPYFALCPDMLGVKNAGTGIGIMDAIAYGFAAAGTATIGILVDHYGYYSAFWFMAICGLIGAVLIKFIRE
jgi:MFS transporter, OPA family, glycerol-3-phosphate transporter